MTDVRDHIAKENVVRQYIKDFSIDTFIETGTYEGAMVVAIAPHVKKVYSIELDEELFKFAQKNVRSPLNTYSTPNVHLRCGDSAKILPEIMKDIKEPCLFWLDAHYSAGITAKGETNTPILKELDAILNSPYDHIILIDDIRLFGKDGWPEFQEVKEIVNKTHPDWSFEVKDDIARIYLKRDFISMTTLGSFGRFGNQLFQYAAMKTYAKQYNLRLEIPENWTGRKVFDGCDDPPITDTPREQKMIEGETPIWMSKELRNCDVKGYFQYHTSCYDKTYFRSLFRFVPKLEEEMTQLYEAIVAKASPVVAIHIRMGDYNIPSREHCIAPSQWYLDWLDENWDKLDNPILFLASDDINKVRRDFGKYNPVSFKDDNFLCDFCVLKNSDILLISNSTFSFTAAMLNEKANKFYRPDFEQKKMVSFDPWDSEPVLKVEQEIKLHLGCGMQRHEGFVNIDSIRTQATDLVCDIRRLPYQNNTVDIIELYHVFEHIPVCLHANVASEYGEKYESLITVLKEWRRVLKRDGQLVIEMPDLDGVIKEYLTADERRRGELLIGIYGSYRNNDNFDIHRWGANEERLKYMLSRAGFRNIKFTDAQDYHKDSVPCLRVEAIK